MPGLLDRKNEDVSITRKLPNGASVTYKSPQDSQMDLEGILGGMVDGYTPTPVSDNTMIKVTPGEYVVNQPAAQKYKGLLEQINNEGKQMLAMGGWARPRQPMGYANGGGVQSRRRTEAGGPAINHPGTTSYTGGGRNDARDSVSGRLYPPLVVLDPNSSPKEEFDRMDQLVRNGIYTIERDIAGRSSYKLTKKGGAYNTQAQGRTDANFRDPNAQTAGQIQAGEQAALQNQGGPQQSPLVWRNSFQSVKQMRDSLPEGHPLRRDLSNIMNQISVTGKATADTGKLKELVMQAEELYSKKDWGPNTYELWKSQQGKGPTGQATGPDVAAIKGLVTDTAGAQTTAPTVTPQGDQIKYKAGQPYNVATKEQAEQFVAAGIVAVGAQFVLPDGTTGRAQ